MSADPEPPVPFIGLTGGMGSGKSTALAALGRLGCATTSADAIVHELYESSDQLRDAVIARFGDDVAPEGVIDRQAVARHAFAGQDDREWLERLIWPLVGERIWRFRQAAAEQRPRPVAAVVETPLLFEAGMEAAYDGTIAIIADEPVRAARVAGRGWSGTPERDARQLSQEEKAARATYVVRNDGSVDELEQQLKAVLEQIASS